MSEHATSTTIELDARVGHRSLGAVIDVDGLDVSYGDFHAVKDLAFQVDRGELYVLEDELRRQVDLLTRRLDTVVAARRSVMAEAPALYADVGDETLTTMLTDPRVRRIEADVSLLLATAGGRSLAERVKALVADPSHLEAVTRASALLLDIVDDAPEADRGRAATALRAATADAPTPGPDDEPVLSLIEDVMDRTVYGRHRDWKDSPEGWPQFPTYG